MYPTVYSHPYYYGIRTPDYRSYVFGDHQQAIKEIDMGIHKEASDIDLYSRLANVAPNPRHRQVILCGLEEKKDRLKKLIDLYKHFKQNPPIYSIDKIGFRDFADGLRKARRLGVKGYQQYQNISTFSRDRFIRDMFSRFVVSEGTNVAWLDGLYGEISNEILTDHGANPFVVNIEEVTTRNNTFRTALWTGKHFQVTVMSIPVGEDIGLEVHPATDQFLRIEQGRGLVEMGDSKDRLNFRREASDDFAIMVPAGKWHNVTNIGNEPIKLYVIYAPPEHPYGTVHRTKADQPADH